MSERGDPGFTFAGIILLAALGAFAWRGAPLESARPLSLPETQPEHLADGRRIAARLWQDPFNAIAAYRRRGDDGAAIAGAQTHLTSEISQLANSGQQSLLTVLSVMLSPGAYNELEEQRRRRRYAVLSGLGDAGFVPRDAESLGVLAMPDAGCATPEEFTIAGGGAESSGCIEIPYEWFDYEDQKTGVRERGDLETGQRTKESVLVLWLDDSRFADEPFKTFRQLVERVVNSEVLAGNDDTFQAKWITLGPARSDTLRHLVADQCSEEVKWLRDDSHLQDFYILSSAATVSDSDLATHRPAECAPRNDNEPIHLFTGPFIEPCNPSDKPTTCLRFLRTIRSDDILIDELKHELAWRGLQESDDIVVISEWDTYFGRFLPRAFESAAPADESIPDFNLLRYTYARGIDGITAGTKPAEPTSAPARQPVFFDVLASAETRGFRRPEGTGQFDYLRRLADKIVAQDQQLKLEKGRGVRAVAILGSDVYDKLLVLRALRHRLPGAVWVTTDLDAHFIHPGEFPWTRNLVIAATFGLALSTDMQPASPPFRDSYQTAAYLATRMAVDLAAVRKNAGWDPGTQEGGSTSDIYPTQEDIYAALPARLFEVGRNGVVLLGPPPSKAAPATAPMDAPFAPSLKGERVLPYGIGIGLISLIGLFALHQLRPRAGRPVLVVGGLMLAGFMLALVAVAQGSNGEPLSLSDGVSVWPTEFLRLVAIFLTATFLWIGYHRLQENTHVLDHRYFDGEPSVSDAGLTLKEAIARLKRAVTHRSVPAWAVSTGLLFLLLMLSMRRLLQLELSLTIKLLLVGGFWALLIWGWSFVLRGKISPAVRLLSINRWVAHAKEECAGELWAAYRAHDALSQRVLRAASYLLVYFAFGTIVFSLLGGAPPPCRGNSACVVDGILLGLGVMSMLFLLFFVMDATRLCIFWIEKMQDPDVKWDDTKRDELAQKFRVPPLHATYWLQIHLIGERTTEVGRLLYYPVVVILIMLLARTTYFDDWGFPQALAIVVGANFLIAVITAARLNAAARRAKDRILDRLQRESLKLRSNGAGKPAVSTPDEIKELIGQLSKLQIGAYQRLWDQPFIRGSLLLLGGIGVTFAEYLPLMPGGG